MTQATLVPAEGQVQFMLDSPMSDAEQAQLEKIETRSAQADQRIVNSKLDKAQCLIEVYQDKLFRGKAGGRSWGDYLQSIDLARLGYTEGLSTEMAGNEMMFGLLCDSIEDWNEANPSRPALPMPKGRSYMEGWTTLFERNRELGGGSNYAPFGSCTKALEAWKTAVFKSNGQAPAVKESRAIGKNARDAGHGRPALSYTGTIETLTSTPRGSQPESVARTVSPQVRMEAAAAQIEREERQAAVRANERSLREDGIDPRSVSVMQKDSDFDVMSECETYSGLLNQTSHEIQRLDVWARGRLNQYGTDGLNMLRQFDAGLYTIKDDISAITQMGERLIELAALLQDDVQPGSMVDGLYESEPTL